MAGCELLAWDTAFWGFPVARVTGDRLSVDGLETIDSWCRANHVACLYFLATPDDFGTTSLAEKSGFELVDVRVTYTWTADAQRARGGRAADEPPLLRAGTPADLDALVLIARASFTDTRFYKDPRFDKQRCGELYAQWIRNSCAGAAESVQVAVWGDQVAGFISCHVSDASPVGSIGLVAVDAVARGTGLGGHLVSGALAWFAERTVTRVNVTTQAQNLAAQRLYQRAGFLISDVHLWFHKWYAGVESP